MFVPHRKHLWASTDCYGDSFTFLYIDDVRTSQETHLWPSTAYRGIALLFFVYIAHLLAFTAHYVDNFSFLYLDYVRTSHETPVGLHGLIRG
jgi:hypothetical protein